jgi:hypothetical protein
MHIVGQGLRYSLQSMQAHKSAWRLFTTKAVNKQFFLTSDKGSEFESSFEMSINQPSLGRDAALMRNFVTLGRVMISSSDVILFTFHPQRNTSQRETSVLCVA